MAGMHFFAEMKRNGENIKFKMIRLTAKMNYYLIIIIKNVRIFIEGKKYEFIRKNVFSIKTGYTVKPELTTTYE